MFRQVSSLPFGKTKTNYNMFLSHLFCSSRSQPTNWGLNKLSTGTTYKRSRYGHLNYWHIQENTDNARTMKPTLF